MIYTGSITKEVISLAAGTLMLNCEFKWPEDVQEQYDKWLAMINTAVKSDPLVTAKGDRVTNYDYLSFYLDNDFNEYEGPIPSSIIAASNKQEILNDRIAQCKSLKKIVDTLEELLRYTCVINDTTVIMVNTGGWYTGPDGVWKIRFLSPRDKITRDTLTLATVEVDDGVNTN